MRETLYCQAEQRYSFATPGERAGMAPFGEGEDDPKSKSGSVGKKSHDDTLHDFTKLFGNADIDKLVDGIQPAEPPKSPAPPKSGAPITPAVPLTPAPAPTPKAGEFTSFFGGMVEDEEQTPAKPQPSAPVAAKPEPVKPPVAAEPDFGSTFVMKSQAQNPAPGAPPATEPPVAATPAPASAAKFSWEMETPKAAEPAAAGDFTQLFSGNLDSLQPAKNEPVLKASQPAAPKAAPIPAPPAPSSPAKFSWETEQPKPVEPAPAGEFTQIFRGDSDSLTPVKNEPAPAVHGPATQQFAFQHPPSAPSSSPSKFSWEQDKPSPPSPAPAGEFTQMFRGDLDSLTSAKDAPTPAAPGPATQKFSFQPSASASPSKFSWESEKSGAPAAGEFTQMFQGDLNSLTPAKPQPPAPATKFPWESEKPAAPPSAAPAGEFTQMFQGDLNSLSAPSKPKPAFPEPPNLIGDFKSSLVDSAPGHGATMQFKTPIAQGSPAPGAQPSFSSPPAPGPVKFNDEGLWGTKPSMPAYQPSSASVPASFAPPLSGAVEGATNVYSAIESAPVQAAPAAGPSEYTQFRSLAEIRSMHERLAADEAANAAQGQTPQAMAAAAAGSPLFAPPAMPGMPAVPAPPPMPAAPVPAAAPMPAFTPPPPPQVPQFQYPQMQMSPAPPVAKPTPPPAPAPQSKLSQYLPLILILNGLFLVAVIILVIFALKK